MKKAVTVYFSPVYVEIEVDDNLEQDEIEQEINKQIYDIQIDDITNETVIDYWEY